MSWNKGLRRQLPWLQIGFLLVGLAGGFVSSALAQGVNLYGPQFVPNSQSVWDSSKNWTANFGPAYRDTVESPCNCWLVRTSSRSVFTPVQSLSLVQFPPTGARPTANVPL
jgi:hypothetical protein